MTFTKKHRLLFPLLIYLLAVVLRLVPVIAAQHLAIGLDDMFQYDMLGRSLAAGEGFRWYGADDLALVKQYIPLEFVTGDYDPRGILTSFRGPGYPFFLSLIYRLFGLENRFFIARLVQVFVVSSLAPMGYALAKRLFPGEEKTARLAAWMLALYPFLVIFPLALATEVIFIPLVLASVLLLLCAAESGRWQDYLFAGAALAAAALTRSVIVAILPAVLLWLWFAVKDKKGALIVLAAVVVLLTPWVVRNSLLHGQFSFLENSMGYNLYLGYHPDTEGRFEFGPSLDLMPYLDDIQRDEIGTEKALGFIRDDPGRVPTLMLFKLGYFFGLERRVLTYFYSNNFLGYIPQPWFTMVFVAFTLPFVLLAVGAALSLPLVRWKRAHLLVGLVALFYLAPHVLILSEPRFHLALVPLLAGFAAHTWTQRRTLATRFADPSNRWLVVLSIVLVALLVFNWSFELWRDADTLKQLFGPQGNRTYFSY